MMKDSGAIIEEKAACDHEVRVIINNLDDLLKASCFDKDDIKEAIKEADCPACVLLQATRDT